ncbi:MAG TPA: DUF1269 domain-containing protein [Candidatus Baltobacteraceae bacterium]|jgi:uncharacterized membrane protein|nr:DUF1269 domain-containing protein [Candidatus Baltobacteraceae bacterium]
MDNYATIVLDSDEKAFEGLHALWDLNDRGDLTVHGATVLHRTRRGQIEVATERTDEGARAIIGTGLGALLGMLAGPVGIGIGAAAGGLAGLAGEGVKIQEREETEFESRLAINPGQSAIVAEVSEDSTFALDSEMNRLDGVVYRRSVAAVRRASFLGDDHFHHLHPYDHEPKFAG